MQHHIRKKHFLQFTNILMHIRQLKKQNIDCDNDNYVDALNLQLCYNTSHIQTVLDFTWGGGANSE